MGSFAAAPKETWDWRGGGGGGAGGCCTFAGDGAGAGAGAGADVGATQPRDRFMTAPDAEVEEASRRRPATAVRRSTACGTDDGTSALSRIRIWILRAAGAAVPPPEKKSSSSSSSSKKGSCAAAPAPVPPVAPEPYIKVVRDCTGRTGGEVSALEVLLPPVGFGVTAARAGGGGAGGGRGLGWWGQRASTRLAACSSVVGHVEVVVEAEEVESPSACLGPADENYGRKGD